MRFLSFAASYQGHHERRLLKWLLNEDRYNPLERPVINESQALVVQFGLVLQQIIDVVRNLSCIKKKHWRYQKRICTGSRNRLEASHLSLSQVRVNLIRG